MRGLHFCAFVFGGLDEQLERTLHDLDDEPRAALAQRFVAGPKLLQAELADGVGGEALQRLASIVEQRAEDRIGVEVLRRVVRRAVLEALGVGQVVDEPDHRLAQRRAQRVLEQLAAPGA
jgi:hypothetical protein